MIEIELFHREPNSHNRAIKVWINSNLIYANEIATPKELIEWRDALHNELLWLNRYLLDEGLEKP